MNNDQGRRILLGRVIGAFGVRGEAKLESWTEPRTAIFRYQPWILRDPQGGERELRGVRGKEVGKSLVASFPDITDRDAIEATLRIGDWERAEGFAAALEAFTRPEPLPWTDFYVARGRALAAHGRGERDHVTRADLARLAEQARTAGLNLALSAVEKALAES